MKHSSLSLNTVYADHDGLPIVLLSLTKQSVGGRWDNDPDRFRPTRDRTFGLIHVRRAPGARATVAELLHAAATLTAAPTHKGQRVQPGIIADIVMPRLITAKWEDHLHTLETERREREEREARRIAQLAEHDQLISEAKTRLPEGARVHFDPHSGNVRVSIADLLAILDHQRLIAA